MRPARGPKPGQKTMLIRISTEAYEELRKHAREFDGPDATLRRILGLKQKPRTRHSHPNFALPRGEKGKLVYIAECDHKTTICVECFRYERPDPYAEQRT